MCCVVLHRLVLCCAGDGRVLTFCVSKPQKVSQQRWRPSPLRPPSPLNDQTDHRPARPRRPPRGRGCARQDGPRPVPDGARGPRALLHVRVADGGQALARCLVGGEGQAALHPGGQLPPVAGGAARQLCLRPPLSAHPGERVGFCARAVFCFVCLLLLLLRRAPFPSENTTVSLSLFSLSSHPSLTSFNPSIHQYINVVAVGWVSVLSTMASSPSGGGSDGGDDGGGGRSRRGLPVPGVAIAAEGPPARTLAAATKKSE